jgi:hypothetical protein
MPILKMTRRNVTIIAWLWFPVEFAICLPRAVRMAWREAAEYVPHMIDTFRPFADYHGEGRGPSVRTNAKEGRGDA